MRQVVAILGLAMLAACGGAPQLGLGFNVGPDGVTVAPNLSGTVGGVNVGVTGQGMDL